MRMCKYLMCVAQCTPLGWVARPREYITIQMECERGKFILWQHYAFAVTAMVLFLFC